MKKNLLHLFWGFFFLVLGRGHFLETAVASELGVKAKSLFKTKNESPPLQPETLVLGDSRLLPLSSPRAWAEDSKVIKILPEGHLLRVFGLKEGASLLSLGDRKFQFFVVHPTQIRTYEKIKEALQKILGLQVALTDGEVHVTGELFRVQDWVRLAGFFQGESPRYQMRAQVAPDLLIQLQKYLDDSMNENHLPRQTLQVFPHFHFRLPVKHPLKVNYLDLFAKLGISIEEDSTALLLEPTVRVQITVAEVQRHWTQKVGLRWPDSFQAQILPSTQWKFDTVEALAQFFEQSGNGRILASPNIICRSGKEAEFLAGGEFPIKILSRQMRDVVWKKYGIQLKVKPLADSLGQISLNIETEVSSIDPSKTIDGIPALATHKVSSHFDLKKSQVVALSGLIKNDEMSSKEGLAFLSRIPILGALFSSQDFRENRSELVILVKPEILDSLPSELIPQHLVQKSLPPKDSE